MSEENYKISIKVEEALLDYMCDKYQHSFNCLDEYDQQLVDSIASLESENARLKEAQRWIPVGERLPQIGVRVLFYNNFIKNIHKGWYSGDEWVSDIGVFYNGDKLKRITHWMPLPESPNDTQAQTIVYGKEDSEVK